MVRHFIIIASSYVLKTRIALDYIYDKNSLDDIGAKIKRIKSECGEDVHISTHSLMVDSEKWESVVAADSFFEQIKVLDTIEQFIMYANFNKTPSGNEIGDYILSHMKCDHLKLQKLIYLCYAEYLCKEKGKLFSDKIYAFTYGPVVEGVYHKYKNSGNSQVNRRESEFQMALESRIVNSEDGVRKLKVIDEVIAKYGSLSSSALVNITHKEGSPWKLTFDNTNFKEIPSEVIRNNHCYET